jgi:uncharacterized phage-like protein YoqJ
LIKIAITGHRPDSFLVSHYNVESIKRLAGDIVAAFSREHKGQALFNLGGAIGVDQWVGDACIEQDVPFYLYLPFHPDMQSKYWGPEQKKELARQIEHARGIHIIEPNIEIPYNPANFIKRNEKMIDDANFVVAFWVGKRRGGTFHAVKYGLESSKFVFNALNELKPIFKDDLKSGWTPPTIKVPE